MLGALHKEGRLYLMLILPDQSRAHIPAGWTDLAGTSQAHRLQSTHLASLDDLLQARLVVDALLRRLAK